jgi:hypothetical protein
MRDQAEWESLDPRGVIDPDFFPISRVMHHFNVDADTAREVLHGGILFARDSYAQHRRLQGVRPPTPVEQAVTAFIASKGAPPEGKYTRMVKLAGS